MAEKKYIAIDPTSHISDESVNMTNPGNTFIGNLVSVNPDDESETLNVRDLFVSHIKVDGKNIQAYTSNKRRVVDISPYIELCPVTSDGSLASFSEWICSPGYTPPGEVSDDNPYPNKRLTLKLRDDGKWVVAVVIQEAEDGMQATYQEITSGHGGPYSVKIKWSDEEINYGSLGSILASRECNDVYGYRLGIKDGLNEGKLLQPAGQGGGGGGSTDEPQFNSWKNGMHYDGLCAGPGAEAYVFDYMQGQKIIVDGGVAFGKNAKVTKSGAIQLGEGTNDDQNTLQFKNYQLVDGNGHIPNARLNNDIARVSQLQWIII